MRARVLLALGALVATAAALAGCAAEAGNAELSNFSLTPERLGWNVGDDARFTLAVQPTLLSKAPAYVVDPDFAISDVSFKMRGAGFGGDYRTKDSEDVSLRLWRNGTRVAEAPLGPGNESVDLTLTVPEKLKDAEYVLELRLFKVGWVKSEPFRVNVP